MNMGDKVNLVLVLISFAFLFSSAMGQENASNYWMERADGYYNSNFGELAIRCYDKVLEHDPTNVSALYKKGIMLSGQYKKDESQVAFNTAINLSPENPHVWNAQGVGFYVNAKHDEAIDDQLIDLDSDHTAVNDRNTYIKSLTGSVGHKVVWEYAFNVSSKTRLIAVGLNPASNHSELLLVFENPTGDPEDAALGDGKLGPVQVVTPGIGQWKIKVYGYNVPDQEHEAFKIKFMSQSYSSDRFNKSLEAYNEAIKLDPLSLTPIIQKATVLMESGQFKEAGETIEGALRIDPSNYKAWYTKGIILIRQGYYEDALKSLSVSIGLAPAFADAWYYKGVVLQCLGRDDEAIIASNNSKILGYTNTIAIPPTKEL
jgi:tetratricopeptide (TPR) repeat protein